ncbi:MAG TPA: MBL fold metallo-hydrolase [Candidatus Baltobacteraceae bacterium]
MPSCSDHRGQLDSAHHIIDVGQADAILIQTPHGHAIMIDTGGRLEDNESGDVASAAESVGEKIVVPFLIRQGIHDVDAILWSHPHGDHKDLHAHNIETSE